jgi:hypothetical protein
MARRMKTVYPPKSDRNVVVGKIDPLRIARGLFLARRGGAHRSAKQPTRARSRRELARQISE